MKGTIMNEIEVALPPSVLTKKQEKKYGPKSYTEDGHIFRITAEVRHDDECDNGHNSFAITATIDEKLGAGRWVDHMGGCCHEEVAKHFPELEPFIKWHLTSTDGPLHYLSNTIYLAGERDCWGLLKGQPQHFDRVVKWNNFPLEWQGHRSEKFIAWLETIPGTDLEIIGVDHEDRKTYGTKYTFGGFGKTWHECPFDSEREASQFLEAMKMGYSIASVPTSWGEGKARELDAARHCAVWPDATDDELTAYGLEQRLIERLPALMERFKADVESLGFVY